MTCCAPHDTTASDSLVCAAYLGKGRSSRSGLACLARQWVAQALAGRCQPVVRWLPSEANTADGPSRRQLAPGVWIDHSHDRIARRKFHMPAFSREGALGLPRSVLALCGWRLRAPSQSRFPLPWLRISAMDLTPPYRPTYPLWQDGLHPQELGQASKTAELDKAIPMDQPNYRFLDAGWEFLKANTPLPA